MSSDTTTGWHKRIQQLTTSEEENTVLNNNTHHLVTDSKEHITWALLIDLAFSLANLYLQNMQLIETFQILRPKRSDYHKFSFPMPRRDPYKDMIYLVLIPTYWEAEAAQIKNKKQNKKWQKLFFSSQLQV